MLVKESEERAKGIVWRLKTHKVEEMCLEEEPVCRTNECDATYSRLSIYYCLPA